MWRPSRSIVTLKKETIHTFSFPSPKSACVCTTSLSTSSTSCDRKFQKSTFLSSSQKYFEVYTRRNFSQSSNSENSQATEGETQLSNTIRKCFPGATKVVVEDISGGCGSMYSVFIESPEFQGLSTVKQHLLVNQALKQEIKSMHGIRIQTAAPKK